MARNTVPIHEFMPVGFRFRPKDEELVNHYLKNKLQGHEFPVLVVPDIDLCKVEPWDIPDIVIAASDIKPDDPEWFFFSQRDYKYARSTRSNRSTEHGYWKATGQDRKIMERGTNNVIGAKKTLVFYKGRSPKGVKTNWVIHEYHATTFDVSQRTFVLCRLMKKPEKKAEGETYPVAYDEGEPSGNIVSDYENQETEERITSVCNSPKMDIDSIFQPLQAGSLQHSPVGFEQEPSFQVSPYLNSYLGNETSSRQSPFETTEEEVYANEFANSVLADGNLVAGEGRAHAFMVSSAQSESLTRVHHESSDTDAEVAYAQYGNVVDTSTLCNEHASSRDYPASKMVQSLHHFVHGGTHTLSSNREARKEKKESMIQNDFYGVETSSSDSTADKHFEINFVEISSPPHSLRRWKNQYQPGPHNSASSQKVAARRCQTLRKVSSNAVSRLKDKKEPAIVESSEKDQNTKTSSDVNGRSSYFICSAMPSSSRQSVFPRSVYLVNVIIGILLFIAISWEVLSC